MLYQNITATSGSSKEPPVAAAEKFISCFLSGDMVTLSAILDPTIVMTCPMGLFHGRPHVKGWLSFDSAVVRRSKMKVKVQNAKMEGDALKTASVTWTVGFLTFVDTVILNQVLLIRAVRRTWSRRLPKNDAELAATNALLLSWTGPHFEKYCTPKTLGVDNRAMVLPVLDFSFGNFTRARDILNAKPREGKTIMDRDVVLHYLGTEDSTKKTGGGATQGAAPKAAATMFGQPAKDEITIRAKNRDGDQGAIVIDRKQLDRVNGAKSVEALEDSEVAVNEDRTRYAASGLRLCSNKLEDPRELDQVIRLIVFNAFYFLTWIDLSTNGMTSIPDLSQYPIAVLYLHDNKISDWDQVKKLAALTQLQTLTLFGNEIQAKAASPREYKFKALAAVKGPGRSADAMALKNFDHGVLLAAERDNVDRYAATPAGRSASATRSRPQSRSM
jgi:hypothetical protein